MNDIDLSTEALLKHRTIAEKAMPGPWRNRFWTVSNGPETAPTELADCSNIADAAHIAANYPDVVKAHVDEILRLRAEVQRLKEDNEAYRVVTANFKRITENLANEIDDNDQEVDAEIASLEAQLDWLAARCHEFCAAHNWCAECCMLCGPYLRETCDCGAEIGNRYHRHIIKDMREAARKAVENPA